ncbi:MAG: hypothetical protein ACE5EV_08900 [Gaiellales bacterium]
MAYIDASYLNDIFGSANVTALCPTTAEQDAVIAAADAEVYGALYAAGYQTGYAPSDLTPATTPELVRASSFGAWLQIAHLRNRKELPESARIYTDKLEAIARGEAYEVPGWTKTTTRAIGGVVKTDTTSSRSDGGRAAVFDGSEMDGWF